MKTYKYYRFPDKTYAPAQWPTSVNVYVIGHIIKTPPVYNNLNKLILPKTYLPGWHVNVCYEGDVDLSFVQGYEITVNNPKCKWFGQP